MPTRSLVMSETDRQRAEILFAAMAEAEDRIRRFGDELAAWRGLRGDFGTQPERLAHSRWQEDGAISIRDLRTPMTDVTRRRLIRKLEAAGAIEVFGTERMSHIRRTTSG